MSTKITPGVLSIEDIENAAITAMSNFGKPDKMIFFGNLPLGYPEYAPLSWSSRWDLSTREKSIAGLHFFLFKLECLKNMSESDHHNVESLS